MKKMFIFLFLILGLLWGNFVLADMIDPSYYTANCPSNKIQKECFYQSKEPFGDITRTNCDGYENNSKCKLLTGTGSSFGGNTKYCCEPGFENTSFLFSLPFFHIKKFVLHLLLTLVLELPFFLGFGFRKKKELLIIAAANIISVLVFYIASFWFGSTLFVVFSELIIFGFEFVFLKTFLKQIPIKKILFVTLAANLVSAVLGTILLIKLIYLF